MKSTASCDSCQNEFLIKEIMFVPWPKKNSWNSVGEQKYKLHCPRCNSAILPITEVDKSSLDEIRNIKYFLMAAVALMIALGLSGFGIYGILTLLFAHVLIIPMFYKMAKFKTRNIFGSGTLIMVKDNDL
jgi:hypothetical protein